MTEVERTVSVNLNRLSLTEIKVYSPLDLLSHPGSSVPDIFTIKVYSPLVQSSY